MAGQKDNISLQNAQKLVRSVPHWHHQFEIYPGLVTPGSYDPRPLWSKLALEGRVGGKRVLDVGASDGFFTNKLADVGADVTAVDFRPKDLHGFRVMEILSGRTFPYEHANIFDLDIKRLGTFDVVLFLGVLYHLPDMMRAFRTLRSLCSGTLLIETHYESALSPNIPAARYYKGDSLAGDITNFWSPNRLCVLDMLEDAGFDPVRSEGWTNRLLAEAEVSREPNRTYKMDIAYGRF